MSLPKFIDKYQTYGSQVSYLKSMLYFGFPAGYIISKVFIILVKGWENFHFSFVDLFIVVLFDLLFLSPLIYNYFKYEKKYLNLIKKISLDNKEHTVKALYNYKKFVKGKSYKIRFDQFDNNFYIEYYPLKNLINKFDLDDIKEERLKKLKKLKRFW